MFLWLFLPCLSVVAADITSYVVDSESSTAVDDDSCTSSPQTNPCKTLQYLLANIEPKNVEVTLNQGTYNLTANITNVTYAENFTLTGSNEPTLQCSSNKTMINFISPKNLTITGLTFEMDEAGAIGIVNGSEVSINTVTFKWDEDATQDTFVSPVQIEKSADITISSISLSTVTLGADLTFVPYILDIQTSESVEISDISDLLSSVGIASVSRVQTVSFSNLNLVALASNKIAVYNASNVTIKNITVGPSSQSAYLSNGNDVNEQMQSLARHISSMSELDSELKRRIRIQSAHKKSSNNLNTVAPFIAAAVIYIGNVSTLTASDLTASNLHTSSFMVEQAESVSISNMNFSQNTHAFYHTASSAESATSRSNRRSASSSVTGIPSYRLLGDGVCITLRNISTKLEISDCEFSNNSITYSPDDLTELESSLLRSSRNSASTSSTRYLFPQFMRVIADLYMDKISSGATVTISGVTFGNEHMSYDEEYLENPDLHFIISDYATKAPTSCNMRHVLTTRPSSCLFVGECSGSVSLSDAEFDTINGTAVAMVEVGDVTVTNLTVTNVYTQAKVFSESAFYIGNLEDVTIDSTENGAKKATSTAAVSFRQVTFTDVYPSPISAKFLAADADGNSGFDYLPSSVKEPNKQFIIYKLGGAAISAESAKSFTLQQANLTRCTTNGEGGCICIRRVQTVRITQSSFTSSRSLYGDGGCIALTDTLHDSLVLNNVNVTNCTAHARGGAIYVPIVADSSNLTVSLTSVIVQSCQAVEGGGLFIASRSESEYDDQASLVCKMSLSSVTVEQCTAHYGAGMFLGSVQHLSQATLSQVIVQSCQSTLSGAAIYFAAAQSDSGESFNLYSSNFTSNSAGGIGGSVFTNLFSGSANADTSSAAVVVDGCSFVSNECDGVNEEHTRYGLQGGGAFTQYFTTNTTSSSFNTVIRNSTFSSNKGGAYAPLSSVFAYLESNTFTDNTGYDFQNDNSEFLLNIECAESKLNITSSNTFTQTLTLSNTVSYVCDSTCSDYTSDVTDGFACTSPKSTTVTASDDTSDPDDYPTISARSYTIAGTEVGDAKMIFSTSDSLHLADGVDEVLAQLLSINQLRARAGASLLHLNAITNRRLGNTTLAIEERSTRTSFVSLTDNDDTETVGIHVESCTAELTGENVTSSQLTTTMKEIKVSTNGDVTLTESGFPSTAPEAIYVYVSADGEYWTDAQKLSFGASSDDSSSQSSSSSEPSSESSTETSSGVDIDTQKKWGWIAFGTMIGMVVLILILDLGGLAIIYFIRRRYGYNEFRLN